MLKILIADDEQLARLGINSFVDWEENGYQVVALAENGRQALELAKLHQPDIVISDIQMPIMTGIELISAAKQSQLTCKFVMLSAFDNFDLVKGALKAGAEDYILKLEMEAESLLAVLDGVRQKILDERKTEVSKAHRKANYKIDQDRLRQVLLREVFGGKLYGEKQLRYQMEKYNYTFHSDYYYTLAVKIDIAQQVGLSQDRVVLSLLRRSIQDNIPGSQIIPYDVGQYAILCSFEPPTTEILTAQQIQFLSQKIVSLARDSINLNISVGISSLHREISGLRRSYLEANYAISSNSDNTKISDYITCYRIREDDVELQWRTLLDAHVEAVSVALSDNHQHLFGQAIDQLIHRLSCYVELPSELILANSHVLNYVMQQHIHNNNLQHHPSWKNLELIWSDGIRGNVLDEYLSWLRMLKDRMNDVLANQRETHCSVQRAKNYVHDHLNQPISLAEISAFLGVSPSYFSRWFSENNNQRFMDYVREQRVKFAQQLIRNTNLKMYEVALKSGYDNEYYFSRVFKKTVGVSPREYRQGK